jgi:hypothetical protein
MFVLTIYPVLNKYSTIVKSTGATLPHASQLKRGFSDCDPAATQAKMLYVANHDFGLNTFKNLLPAGNFSSR